MIKPVGNTPVRFPVVPPASSAAAKNLFRNSDRLRSLEKAPGNLTGHQRAVAFQEPETLESGVLRYGLIEISKGSGVPRFVPVICQVKDALYTTDD